MVGQVKGQRRPIAEVLQSTPAYRALDPRDQSLVRALVTHFFRHHHALDAVFAPHLSRPLDSLSPAALGPLRLGTVELLAMGSAAHATLNETVALTPKALRGLVNAVLRTVLKNEEESKARFADALAVPPWLMEGWQATFGETRANALTAGLREVPHLDLTLKPGTAFDLGEAALDNHRRLPTDDPRTLPGFAKGDWWVQDLAASLPVRLAGDLAGKRALDVCAAPGGKTMQLAAGGAEVTALDISKARLARVRDNLDRTKLSVDLACQDALKYEPKERFDLILLDAPCSASGTLRRHPEWPWIHARKDQLAHVPTQAALLRKSLDWLTPGGKLIYA
ncbi:MAG: transcription antitermination factor NusB, partial [Pseudomonadota bacterium]